MIASVTTIKVAVIFVRPTPINDLNQVLKELLSNEGREFIWNDYGTI